MKRILTVEDIRVVLPHRDRMLLLVGAEIDTEASLGRARIEIGHESTGTSWCEGMACPHLYVTEALAQLSGVTLAWLAVNDPEAGVLGFLVELPELRFEGKPTQGDVIDLWVRKEIAFGPMVRFEVRARCDGEEIVAGCLTIAIDPGDHQA